MGPAEPGELTVERKESLVEASEGHLRLELHACRAQNLDACDQGHLGRGIQQHRLACAGLTENQQRRPTGPGPVEKRPDRR